MAKIIAPNKQYTGVSASVAFAQGIGQTDNPKLIQWFKDHGYTVEETKAVTKTKAEQKADSKVEPAAEQKGEAIDDGKSAKSSSKAVTKTKAAAEDSK